MRISTALGLSIAGLLVASTPASAYEVGGTAWNKRTIAVSSTLGPRHEPAVRAALAAWSHSGARIRLVLVRHGGDLHIVPGTASSVPGGMAGVAPIGMQPNRIIRIRVGYDRDRQGIDYTFARIITHELGHALGLGHSSRRCATMAPVVPNDSDCIRSRARSDFGAGAFCRLLQADDVRGAVRLYGGRARLAPLICHRAPAPSRPTLAPAESDGNARPAAGLDVLWSAPDGYPVRELGHLETMAAAAAGRCPATIPERQEFADAPGGRAAIRRLRVDLPQTGPRYGSFCVSVWTIDDAGRVSPPASIWIERGDGSAVPAPGPGY